MKKGFTLVEVLLVVAILGIMAAIVFPEFQNHVRLSREAAAKDTLRMLREQIGRYTIEHDGTPPGYMNGLAIGIGLQMQFSNYTNTNGTISPTKTAEFKYGPYFKKIPTNPFNNLAFSVLGDEVDFPESPDGLSGWIYKPATQEIRLNYPGTDSKGIDYYDY